MAIRLYALMSNEGIRKILQDLGVPDRFLNLGELSFIGSGSTSDVFRISGERNYALKVIDCSNDEQKYKNARYEIRLMERLSKCESVVRLLDSEVVSNSAHKLVCILEEYCIPAKEYLKTSEASYSDRVQMIADVCEALRECRGLGILHLDVQPGNLFVGADGRMKIGDFGSSLFIEDLFRHRRMRGTLAYMAPEVYREGLCSEQSDIYSLGMVLHWLLDNAGKSSRKYKDDLSMYKRLAGAPIEEISINNEDFRGTAMSVIRQMCAYEPAQRMRSFEDLEGVLNWFVEEIKREHWDDASELLVMIDPRAISVALSVMSVSVPFHQAGLQSRFPGMPVPEGESGGHEGIPMDPHCLTVNPFERDWLSDDVSAFQSGSPVPPVPTVIRIDLGETSEEIAEEPVRCRVCGHVMELRGNFCSFCGSYREIPKPKVDMHQVSFSAVAPKQFRRNDYYPINVLMYEAGYRHVVDEIKEEIGEQAQEKKGRTMKVAENACIRVCLSSDGIQIREDTIEEIWTGGFLNFQYYVMVPKTFDKDQIWFQAKVYVDNVLATRLEFVARCNSSMKQKLVVSRNDVASAFVSYASQDRRRVINLIQGMQKVLPQMEIFFDKDSLRSGEKWVEALYREIERRDVFYLCWSRYALQSKWVDREWRYALEKKGEECIEPIPLEHSIYCPPPEELKHKHFDDRLLYYADIPTLITENLDDWKRTISLT